MPDFDADPDDVGDDLLRLVFVSCHPVLSTEARVALTLRLLGGLTTGEIARAFLTSEPTIAQRIVRAKRTLAEKNIPFEVPRGVDLAERLSSVLEVVYLIFNEGYSATAGDDWTRPARSAEDALRLGRILCELAPHEPEVYGLVALMEIHASRSRARVGPSGEPVLLFDQNRARWDQLLIHRDSRHSSEPKNLAGCRWSRRSGSLRTAGGDCRMSRTGAHAGRDRLVANRDALWGTRSPCAISRGGAESRGGGGHGLRSGSRTRTGRCARLRTRARKLPSIAERAWRSATETRPRR